MPRKISRNFVDKNGYFLNGVFKKFFEYEVMPKSLSYSKRQLSFYRSRFGYHPKKLKHEIGLVLNLYFELKFCTVYGKGRDMLLRGCEDLLDLLLGKSDA